MENQREIELNSLHYSRVVQLAKNLGLETRGGKAAMIPRILAAELEETQAEEEQEDQQEEGQEEEEEDEENLVEEEEAPEKEEVALPPSQTPVRKRAAPGRVLVAESGRTEKGRALTGQVNKKPTGRPVAPPGRVQPDTAQLQQFMEQIAKRTMDNETATMERLEDLQSLVHSLAGQRASAQARDFWPEKRLREFQYQAEYDHQIALGRIATQLRLDRPEDNVVQKATKELENLISGRAAKIVVADSEGEDTARGLYQPARGTFMEQWEPKIEKLRQKRKSLTPRADHFLDNLDLWTEGPPRKATRGIATCNYCKEEGHWKINCPVLKKKNVPGGQSRREAAGAPAPPSTQ